VGFRGRVGALGPELFFRLVFREDFAVAGAKAHPYSGSYGTTKVVP
jgi:hypothetical protein